MSPERNKTQKEGHRKKLMEIYDSLYKKFGPRRWWPGDTKFEIIAGAILTQNTSWANVEKAIASLKTKKILTPEKLYRVNIKTLSGLIRPSGYYNIKAKRLKSFLDFLFARYKGSLKKMFADKTGVLRNLLLKVRGIGPETADSILLYAADRPVFVVDAYTKRIFSRQGLIGASLKYSQVQHFFMQNLPADSKLFNEYHALIVELGKNICKTKPRCQLCPLRCHYNCHYPA